MLTQLVVFIVVSLEYKPHVIMVKVVHFIHCIVPVHTAKQKSL